MKTLKLKSGHEILLDDKNFERISKMGGWYVDGRGYAITDKRINGKRVIIDMHRLIHTPQKGFVTDHENQNKLDNQEHNLRDATKSLNALNSKISKSNTSGYKGVCWSKIAEKWRAYINLNGRQFHLGYFDNPEDASAAYQLRLKEIIP